MRTTRLGGQDLPRIITPIPGPRSRAWVDRLAPRECPAITARRARSGAPLGSASVDPPVWVSARGCNVLDADGNVLVDLTAGFAVASVGHAHPRVVSAGQQQMATLPHAMADVFFDPRRVELMETLHDLTGLDGAIFGSSGSDAVEAAMKTARLATSRSRILAFRGAYHGLSLGALPATDYLSDHFRAPFAGQVGDHVSHAPFGGPIPPLEGYAAVLLEPIQGRGGIHLPPPGWLAALTRAARAARCLVIFDEIFTGFGRTGRWFAYQREGLRPDILCLGKGMAAGFPISVCLGTDEVMHHWGPSAGESLHTQTFLGNPVGCAMALAAVAVLREEDLPQRAQVVGAGFARSLAALPGVTAVRGAGLMLAAVLEPGVSALAVSRAMLRAGYIVLPAGDRDDALGFTPPLTISHDLLQHTVSTLGEVLQ